MDINRFDKVTDTEWRAAPHDAMRVPAVLFADEALIRAMDDKVYEQMTNVATLPGIVGASYAMPDAHWGYGFPIGGVAAFDPRDGVISAGGVGFDISCGVRTLTTGISGESLANCKEALADALFSAIPAGVAAGAPCPSTTKPWTPCCQAAPPGQWARATANRTISPGWRKGAAWLVRGPNASRRRPSSASSGKWTHWAPATTTSSCSG